MPKCEIREYIEDLDIDDYEWAQCANEATHELAYIRPQDRATVWAAQTTMGWVNYLQICEDCAEILATMHAGHEDWGRWIAIDADPDPLQ